jgi:O-antigen ligase
MYMTKSEKITFSGQPEEREMKQFGRHLPGVIAVFIPSLIFIGYNYQKELIDFLFDYSPIVNKVGQSGAFLLFIVLVMRSEFGAFLIAKKRYTAYLYVFIYILVLSALFAEDKTLIGLWKGVYAVGSCWLTFMMFMYIGRMSGKSGIFQYIWLAIVFFSLCNCLVGLYGAFTGKSIFGLTREIVGVGAFGYDPSTGRAGGFRGENYAGAWNAPAFAFGISLLSLRKSKGLTVLGGLLASTSFLGTVASLSRTSVACLLVASFICLTLVLKRITARQIALFVIMGYFLTLAIPYLLESQMSYFSPRVKEYTRARWNIKQPNEFGRSVVWKEYLKTSVGSPIWGHGPEYIEMQVAGGRKVPHNSFLDILVEFGILGLSLYILPFILTVRYFMAYRKSNNRDGYVSSLFISFFGMAPIFLSLSTPFLKIVWIVAGLLHGRFLAVGDVTQDCQPGSAAYRRETCSADTSLAGQEREW